MSLSCLAPSVRAAVASAVVLVALALSASCGTPRASERLARQASLGMTIEHQALRFADRLVYDSIDCAAGADENAAAIAATVSGNLGSCAEVGTSGTTVDVVTGASCDFGEHVYASLETHVTVSRDGADLVLAIDLPRARINGLDTVGTVTLRTADCTAFELDLDVASAEYTIATPAGAPLAVTMERASSTVTGTLDVLALGASAGERELTVEHDAMVVGAGQCWPEAGAIVGRREPETVTITFDATTTMAGIARISPPVAGASTYALPEYGPCPDTDPRP